MKEWVKERMNAFERKIAHFWGHVLSYVNAESRPEGLSMKTGRVDLLSSPRQWGWGLL